MATTKLVGLICDGAAQYARLPDQVSRTSARAKLLQQLDELQLRPGATITTRRVTAAEFGQTPLLRGAAVAHLDLVFRSSVTAHEVLLTAERGVLRFAFHADLEGFPLGVMLAQPVAKLVRTRGELFDSDVPAPDVAPIMMPYAIAASPGRLGAGRALINALIGDCASLTSRPQVVTFSPLTGMRARIIRQVDDGTEWAKVCALSSEINGEMLRTQLLQLLERVQQPDLIPEPARSWLKQEGRRFAESSAYAVGNFHRAMGAALVGLTECADALDSDALWARAYFDYGRSAPE